MAFLAVHLFRAWPGNMPELLTNLVWHWTGRLLKQWNITEENITEGWTSLFIHYPELDWNYFSHVPSVPSSILVTNRSTFLHFSSFNLFWSCPVKGKPWGLVVKLLLCGLDAIWSPQQNRNHKLLKVWGIFFPLFYPSFYLRNSRIRLNVVLLGLSYQTSYWCQV